MTQAISRKAHKGVGMSQTEAYAYAAQGYDKGANLGGVLPWCRDSKAGGRASLAHNLFFARSYLEKEHQV